MKPKKKKGNHKPKLNVILGEETKQKFAALAKLEKRSVSNLIEVIADGRWEELADREGIEYAKTVAEIVRGAVETESTLHYPRTNLGGHAREYRRFGE